MTVSDAAFEPELPFPVGQSPFHMKGLFYHAPLVWLDENVDGGRARVIAELRTADERAFFSQPFLASGWYDVFPAPALNAAAGRVLGMSAEDYTRMRTRMQAEEDLRGVYRMILRLVSAETTARYLPKITAKIFDFGTAETRVLGPNRVEGIRGGTPEALVDWYRLAAVDYVDAALRASGARDPVIETELLPERSTVHRVPTRALRFEMSWR